jgi:hypothetical protein
MTLQEFLFGSTADRLDGETGEEGIGCSREEGSTVVQDDLGDACEDASAGLALKSAPSGANSGIRDSFFPQIQVFMSNKLTQNQAK